MAACLIPGGDLFASEPIRLVVPSAASRHLEQCRIPFIDGIRDQFLVANLWASTITVSPFDCRSRFYLSDGRLAAEIAASHSSADASGASPNIEVMPGPGFQARKIAATPEPVYLLTAAAPVAPALAARPVEVPDEATEESKEPFLDAFSTTGKAIASMGMQKPTMGGLNPDNAVLDLPGQFLMGELRWDLHATLDRLQLMAKPRLQWTRETIADGPSDGDVNTESDLLLLEGVARFNLFDTLFLSFGRENLQWGPSQFVNPSNPFFTDNGRENPIREVPGMDFLRVVWLPSYDWTLSWIVNTGEGEADADNQTWRSSQSWQAEYVGYTGSAGALLHSGSGVPTSLRGYFRWIVSDAAMLYGEASLARKTNVRYPTEDGTGLADSKDDDEGPHLFGSLGASYTFAVGPTLYLEYVRNSEGYSDEEAERFFDLGHSIGTGVQEGGLDPATIKLPATELRLLRRNYLFFQYLQTEIANQVTALLRWTQNLDDQSGLGSAYLEWNVSDRWRLFTYGDGGTGGNRDEFGSVIRWRAIMGAELALF